MDRVALGQIYVPLWQWDRFYHRFSFFQYKIITSSVLYISIHRTSLHTPRPLPIISPRISYSISSLPQFHFLHLHFTSFSCVKERTTILLIRHTRDTTPLCNRLTTRRTLPLFTTSGHILLLKAEYLFAADPSKCCVVLRVAGSCR